MPLAGRRNSRIDGETSANTTSTNSHASLKLSSVACCWDLHDRGGDQPEQNQPPVLADKVGGSRGARFRCVKKPWSATRRCRQA